ncbi:MAG TPA: hypothetical protein VNL74_08195 [Methylococcus sp.]|nr:hypothetical protein [Methylococcus sp.]
MRNDEDERAWALVGVNPIAIPRIATTRLANALSEGFGDDAELHQSAHARTNGGRIEPLLARIHLERPDSFIAQGTEKVSILRPTRQSAADHCAGCAHRRKAPRFMAHIQGVVPPLIERRGFDGRGITQVMQLLKNKRAHYRMRILARPCVWEKEAASSKVGSCFSKWSRKTPAHERFSACCLASLKWSTIPNQSTVA